MSVQTRSDEAQSIIRADTPYPAMLLIGRRDAGAGGVANFDFQNIPAAYSKLIIDLYGRGDTAAGVVRIDVNFNADGGANYDYIFTYSRAVSTLITFEAFAQISGFSTYIAAATSAASVFDAARLEIPAYANAQAQKVCLTHGAYQSSRVGSSMGVSTGSTWWRSTAAVNQITLTPAAGNFAQYSTCRLYGVY